MHGAGWQGVHEVLGEEGGRGRDGTERVGSGDGRGWFEGPPRGGGRRRRTGWRRGRSRGCRRDGCGGSRWRRTGCRRAGPRCARCRRAGRRRWATRCGISRRGRARSAGFTGRPERYPLRSPRWSRRLRGARGLPLLLLFRGSVRDLLALLLPRRELLLLRPVRHPLRLLRRPVLQHLSARPAGLFPVHEHRPPDARRLPAVGLGR